MGQHLWTIDSQALENLGNNGLHYGVIGILDNAPENLKGVDSSLQPELPALRFRGGNVDLDVEFLPTPISQLLRCNHHGLLNH